MSEFKLTPSQQEAVDARGSSLLVSAAAGSGKTRVLVDRLMSYVAGEGRLAGAQPDVALKSSGDAGVQYNAAPDSKRELSAATRRDITSFLIITYTKAAAAELRSRILDELTKRLAKDPMNGRLRRQAALCRKADIGTIHSFCSKLLRENPHLAGIAGDFRVLDSEDAESIKAGILVRLLEKEYESIADKPGFKSLVDTVGAGRSDERLISVVLELHTSMQSHVSPRAWALRQLETLRERHTDAGGTVWGRLLLENAGKTARFWRGRLEAALSEAEATPGAEKLLSAYGPSISETSAEMGRLALAAEDGYSAARECFPIPFPRLSTLRGFEDTELQNRVKSIRAMAKKAMEKLASDFEETSDELTADMERTRPAMEALVDLTLRFDDAFSAEKRRRGVVDFADLEHLVVGLLVKPDTREPTDLAIEVSRRYTEIMVDEYQDVNAVQDIIFGAVSDSGRNLFMVGDVKQSIYRFRLADPGIFIRKYHEGGEPDSAVRRVLLRENFRSRGSVIDAANAVFGRIMSEELGEIEYDDNARLVPGATYPDNSGQAQVEFNVLAAPEGGDEESPDKTAHEAKYVAGKIRELMNTGATVTEKDALRPIGYGDIAILLRSPGSAGAVYRRVLREHGIPVDSEQGGGFFESAEISFMLSILTVIDNPRQDVPLIAVLRGEVFGFTPDELAEIRVTSRDGDFYSALIIAAESNAKRAGFLRFLNALRETTPDLPLSSLVWRIYDDTGLLSTVLAMNDGEVRRGRLMLLFEYAREFESRGYRGLHEFTAFMQNLKDSGTEPRVKSPGSGGAVRIMSIHKSKGLEFPVVFLCDTARKFNKRDTMKTVLAHPELGLGPKVTDLERGIEYPTLPRRAIAKRIVTETLSEEMRVLYVAMTRAREYLYISCVWKEPEKELGKLRDSMGATPPPPLILEGQSSPSHWIALAALSSERELGSESPIDMSVVYQAGGGGIESGELLPKYGRIEPEPPHWTEDAEYGDFKYPHQGAVSLPSKLTATSLKGRLGGSGDSDDAEGSLVPVRKAALRRPDFHPEVRAGKLSATERGTAAHLVMQYIDYAKAGAADGIESEIRRLVESALMTKEQAESVDRGVIQSFFNSELGRRIRTADRVYREFRFSLLCDASDYYEDAEGERILLQGVVDCCIEEAGKLTIIDFKSDYVNETTAHQRAEEYAPQLRAYASAMSRILQKPVDEAVVYFFRIGSAYNIELPGS